MKTWTKVLIIALVFGLPAFLLGPVIWTPHPDVHPTNVQKPFFILLSLIEALVFGLGIAFIYYGWSLVQKANPKMKGKAMAFYMSVSWLLVSWWPHDNSHIHNGLNPMGLLVIDYVFHLTLIITSLIIAYNFFHIFKEYSQRTTKQK